MRVRHLQTHLSDQGLVNSSKLNEQLGCIQVILRHVLGDICHACLLKEALRLRDVHVGVDAVFWLRSIQALKDPFADALGGIPPGIFGFVDKELDQFRESPGIAVTS